MRAHAPRSIGISLVAAAMVLGTPAVAYALYGPVGLVLSAIGVFAVLGFATFLIYRWGHRVGAVSFVVVSGGLLVALVSIPIVLPRDRLTSDAEVQRHCPGAAVPLESLDAADRESRDLTVTLSEARAAGLPAPRYADYGLLFEPVATSPEEHFDVTIRPLGTRWVGWYEAAPDPAQPGRRFALLTLRAEPRLRTELVGLVERHDTVRARLLRVTGDRIAIHRGDAEGTLELRDSTLALRASASGLWAERARLFPNGAGGVCALGGGDRHAVFWHVDADGRTARRPMESDFGGFLDLFHLYSCDVDGFCFGARGGTMRMEGDPLRPVSFDLLTIARDNKPLVLALLGAIVSLLLAFIALRSRLRVVLALRRAPLVGRLRTLGLGARVLIDERGDEHPIERIDALVGFDPALEGDGDEPCVALGASSLTAGGGPYRGGRTRLFLRLLIAGTLDEARALARRRLLDRMSYVGLALLVTAAPCLLIAFALLFTR